MTTPLDPYTTLQVDSEAEDEVIVAAYRRLARKYHPDVTAGPEAAARMTAINAAWELIGDPKKRAAFDRERLVQAAMSRSRGAGAGATSGGAPSGGGAVDVSGRGTSGGQAGGGSGAGTAGTAGPGGGGGAGATGSSGNASGTPPPRPPETVSRDWTSGRSTVGGGYDPSMRTADGDGAAGPPPGNPSGSVLNFGRYNGWSLGEIARADLEYIEWLDRTPIGRPYREEIDGILRRTGRRRSAEVDPKDRRGLFRRR